jgi:hypothetical protein
MLNFVKDLFMEEQDVFHRRKAIYGSCPEAG